MTEQNKTTTIPLPVPGKDMDSIMQSLESGVEELFTSNRYQEFLKTMAKFHNYSFNNTMLIAMQRPDATLVTSYKNWQSMGRQVMKGEKGITIIAPAPYKKMKEKEVLDENQRPIMGSEPTDLQNVRKKKKRRLQKQRKQEKNSRIRNRKQRSTIWNFNKK